MLRLLKKSLGKMGVMGAASNQAGLNSGRYGIGYLTVYRIIIIVAAIFVCSACAEKKILSVARPAVDKTLFARAEKLFDAKLYEEALAEYQAYLAQFPGKSMADAALMKIGMIYAGKGDFRQERLSFQRLMTDYPDSPFAPDARVAVLSSLYREGEYSAAIVQAEILLSDTFLSRNHMLRIYTLLGDIYAATALIPEAVIAYTRAYERAEPGEQLQIWERLKGALSSLAKADIERFLEVPPKDKFGGFFLYQLGLGFAELDRDQESIGVLSRMLTLYPDHEQTADAKGLLEILVGKTRYNRFAIGCLLPLTGNYKTYGQRALKGIELALSQFSEQKEDAPFQIIIKDTASDSARSVAAVQELCDAQVAAIIGPILTARSAAQAAQECGIPIITMTGKDGIVTVGDYVFRHFITPGMQINTIVPYFINDLGLSRFAVLYPEEKYGTTLMNLFWDAVIIYGGTVMAAEAYPSDATDFSPSIRKLVGLYYEMSKELKDILNREREGQDAQEDAPDSALGEALELSPEGLAESWLAEEHNEEEFLVTGIEEVDSPPISLDDEENGEGAYADEENQEPQSIVDFDAVFIPDAANKVGLIVPQLAFYDVEDVILMGTNLWHSDTLIKMAKGYVQGGIFPTGFFHDSQLPHVTAFVDFFERVYGHSPGFIEAISYDTAMMLLALVDQPDMLFRSALRDGIGALKNYPGVTGRTSFTESGDVDKELFLLKIKRDRFQALQTNK